MILTTITKSEIVKDSDMDKMIKTFDYLPMQQILGTDPNHLTTYMAKFITKNLYYYQIQYKSSILLRVSFNTDGSMYDGEDLELCSFQNKDLTAKIVKVNSKDITPEDCKKFVDDEFIFRVELEKREQIQKRMLNMEKDFM